MGEMLMVRKPKVKMGQVGQINSKLPMAQSCKRATSTNGLHGITHYLTAKLCTKVLRSDQTRLTFQHLAWKADYTHG